MKTVFTLLLTVLGMTLQGCDATEPSTSHAPVTSTPDSPQAGGPGEIVHDLNTPEGAILSLEDAYRNQDVEAAVRCKDFTLEADLMLSNLSAELKDDPKMLAQTAEVLELGFRSDLKNDGFPDFRGIVSTFSDQKPFQGRADIVELTETCRTPDGKTTQNRMVVGKSASGWKVLSVVD